MEILEETMAALAVSLYQQGKTPEQAVEFLMTLLRVSQDPSAALGVTLLLAFAMEAKVQGGLNLTELEQFMRKLIGQAS